MNQPVRDCNPGIPNPSLIYNPTIPGLSISQSHDFRIEKQVKNYLTGSKKSLQIVTVYVLLHSIIYNSTHSRYMYGLGLHFFTLFRCRSSKKLLYNRPIHREAAIFFGVHLFNAWQKLANFFTYIKESISYNSMYLILACVKNFV